LAFLARDQLPRLLESSLSFSLKSGNESKHKLHIEIMLLPACQVSIHA
jgi:hypothetical protein